MCFHSNLAKHCSALQFGNVEQLPKLISENVDETPALPEIFVAVVERKSYRLSPLNMKPNILLAVTLLTLAGFGAGLFVGRRHAASPASSVP